MTITLSQSDVDRLLADPSARTRAEVASTLGRDLDSPLLSASQVEAAQDIIRVLARDVEVMVRTALSESLRQAKRLPHDVALTLANDVDAVALPILGNSLALTNNDLLEIIKRGLPEKQAAIAGRPTVAEPVAAALIMSGNETTVSRLMRNPGAKVSELSLIRAIDRFPDSDAVKDGMVHRDSLPITVTERLVALVSDQLQDYLVARHKLPPELAGDLALRSRERAMLHLSNGLGWEHVEPLVAQMLANGRLTPTLILRALCIGDMAFFEAALAALANIPISSARILIHDAGQNGFVALYKKCGLPSGLFSAFRAAVDSVDSAKFDGEEHDMERFRSRVITRVLTLVEDFPQNDLDYLLERLGDVLAANWTHAPE